jgi:hypothetical protein
MPQSKAYRFGQALADFPKSLIIAPIVVGIIAIWPSEKPQTDRKPAGATPSSAFAVNNPCKDQTGLLEKYRVLSADQNHWQAAAVLRPCAATNHTEFLELVRQSELADAKQTANNKQAPTITREHAIERIESLAPGEAAGFAALKRQLESKARAEAKAAALAVAAEKKKRGVVLGMTQDDVLASSWGRPESINKSIYSFGVREQWVYGQRNYLYFKDGILNSIQTGN